MLAFLIPFAFAGSQIAVTSDVGGTPSVDGASMMQGATVVTTGKHVVTLTSAAGKTLWTDTVSVPADARLDCRFASKVMTCTSIALVQPKPIKLPSSANVTAVSSTVLPRIRLTSAGTSPVWQVFPGPTPYDPVLTSSATPFDLGTSLDVWNYMYMCSTVNGRLECFYLAVRLTAAGGGSCRIGWGLGPQYVGECTGAEAAQWAL